MDDPQFLDESIDAEIDLTPLIDVVFLLLLFFILAASFSAPVMQVALPAARTAERVESDPSRLVLSIDEAGRLHHRGEAIGVDDLPGLLAAHPEGAVELRVDRAAPFDAFVGVMDPLRAAGRNDVHLAAQPE
jgi:biopolymer transport protein ExbD